MQWNFEGINPMTSMAGQAQTTPNRYMSTNINMNRSQTMGMGMGMETGMGMEPGMNTLNDKMIATDLLMAAKEGVRNYAYALTEAATPEIRSLLKQQFNDAVNLHERVAAYMMNKGYYTPYDISHQVQMDIQTSKNIMNLR